MERPRRQLIKAWLAQSGDQVNRPLSPQITSPPPLLLFLLLLLPLFLREEEEGEEEGEGGGRSREGGAPHFSPKSNSLKETEGRQ